MLVRHLFFLFVLYYSGSAFAQTAKSGPLEQPADEVLIHVRLSGDTLEFNADAFTLDTDAVIEDLFPKFPGLVVWDDGSIIYSGKEVAHVLVNGKPFFGIDKGIPLQNITKDAVSKVQIYDIRTEEARLENPYDPVYEINVVLKEGRERLYFGNLTLAGGTEERYEGNLNLSIANRRLQATVAYSGNNTNKYLESVDQQLKNTAFKGSGVKADFDSHFLREGILRQRVLGGRVQYELGEVEEDNRLNLITGDILTRWDRTLLRDSSVTQLPSATEFGANTRSNVSGNEEALQSQRGNFQYLLDKDHHHRVWSLGTHLALNHENRDAESTIHRLYNYPNSRSHLNLIQNSRHVGKGMIFETTLSIGESSRGESVKEQLRYTFEVSSNLNQNRSDGASSSVYQVHSNDGVPRNTNRLYGSLQDEGAHSFAATVAYNLFHFSNRLNLYRSDTDARVTDIRNDGNIRNEELTHVSRFNRLTYSPSLGYELRLYSRVLPGQVYEHLGISGELGYRIRSEDNESTLAHRNLKRNYGSVVPKAVLNYQHSQDEMFTADASIAYTFDETYPTLQQLRPFYDDIDPSYRYFGGPYLGKSSKQSLIATLDFRELKAYGMSWYVQAGYDRSQNGLSDSIWYSEGQQQVYTVNIERPMRSFNAEAQFARAFPLGWDQNLRLTVSGSRGWNDRFQYVDGREQNVQLSTKSASLDAYYKMLNKVQVAWSNHWNRYDRASLTSAADNYSSAQWRSGFCISYELSSKWNIASNAAALFNTSTFHKDKALVWNANSTYRLLRDRNLQVRVAAFDLLRQFKGVYQRSDVNEFTAGYHNHLNSYFMISVSYSPGKFGQ